MLNTFEEMFEVTQMRTFKHEPFFIVGGGGGGAYSWYFTVLSISHCIQHEKNRSVSQINPLTKWESSSPRFVDAWICTGFCHI